MCFHREYQSALLCPFHTPRQFLQRTPIGIPVCLSRKRYAGQTGNVPASCRARILHQPAKLRTLFCPCLLYTSTPTDNPVIEAVNGRIKQEMRLDFSLHLCGNLQAAPDEFVFYYNHIRPALALNYRSPVQF